MNITTETSDGESGIQEDSKNQMRNTAKTGFSLNQNDDKLKLEN